MANELINIKANLDTELVPVKSLLPAHVSYERFVNAAAVALATNRDLFNADQQSVINSLTACAKDGLIPDGREAALVVYKQRQPDGSKLPVAQYMPMIDGVMKRARQSGEVAVIATRVVYANDTFRVWLDDDGEHVIYEPSLAERGEMRGAFAYAKMKAGELQYEWLNIDDINKVRAASRNSDRGPWVDWYESMARKSAAHRLCRRLPNNSEIMEMLERGTEMVWQEERDITPQRAGLKEIAASPVVTESESVSTDQEAAGNIDALADEFRDRISAAETTDQARAIGDDIAAQRSLLGAALFTELKNKAVMRHHQLKACNTLEGLINTLPNPDEPGAAERFAEVERKLATAKNHLGPELYEQFSTTLLDMRPEYIAD
ncbi:recombinase RecT [Dickeya fangzhongdai]|uniref:recombinase RecT n=1 Tax=Dickeya fangzhongdai TaxID=1778540 RepID=UPI00136D64BF|nr:recombinase RecT [Dickeya fangzhongdai]UMB78836.1 recombinase RecT [Dickeya fangzhongdai]